MLGRGGRRSLCLLAQALSHDAGRGCGALATDGLPKGFRSLPASDLVPVVTATGAWIMHGPVAFFASKGGKHGGKGAKAAAQAPQEVPDWDVEPFVTQMGEALDQLRRKLAGIRTGRASPGLLESISVEARSSGSSHGPHVPLRVLGTVVARGPQLLVVELYEKEDAEAVAKAIQNSPVKLQARAEGGEVLVPVPRLTMEMVERFTKLAAQEAEAARKTAVQHGRPRGRAEAHGAAGPGCDGQAHQGGGQPAAGQGQGPAGAPLGSLAWKGAAGEGGAAAAAGSDTMTSMHGGGGRVFWVKCGASCEHRRPVEWRARECTAAGTPGHVRGVGQESSQRACDALRGGGG